MGMKKWIFTVLQIGGLYVFYWIGAMIQKVSHIPIPGSIIGMLLLFLLLMTNVVKEEWLLHGGQWLLSHLTLLFIPATVGIMDYFSLFAGKGALSIFVVIVSTCMVMVFVGFIGQWAEKKQEHVSSIQQTMERMNS
jgi:holin-like protein